MNNSTMFEALSKVESNLILCKSTARLLGLVPMDGTPYADEIIAISNAIEIQKYKPSPQTNSAAFAAGLPDRSTSAALFNYKDKILCTEIHT